MCPETQGTFRTTINIQDKVLPNNSSQPYTANYCYKALNLRCLRVSLIPPLKPVLKIWENSE